MLTLKWRGGGELIVQNFKILLLLFEKKSLKTGERVMCQMLIFVKNKKTSLSAIFLSGAFTVHPFNYF